MTQFENPKLQYADREVVKRNLLSQNEGIIEIKSIMTPNHTRKAVPKYDSTTAWYKGVKRLSKELVESGNPYVDPTNPNNPLASVILKHNMTFDLSNERDRLILEWLFETDAVAMTREECERSGSVYQTFYVYNQVLETTKQSERYKLKDTAILQLLQLPDEQLPQTVRLMGYKMDNKSNADIKLFIRELFEDKNRGFESAKLFLSVIHDANREIKILAHKLIDRSVVTVTTKGEYKYKEHFIGLSMEAFVSWLQLPENKELVDVITEELGEPLPVKRGRNAASKKESA